MEINWIHEIGCLLIYAGGFVSGLWWHNRNAKVNTTSVSHDSAMDAIACEYLKQLITRYESTSEINDRDFLIGDLLDEWKRKQQHHSANVARNKPAKIKNNIFCKKG